MNLRFGKLLIMCWGPNISPTNTKQMLVRKSFKHISWRLTRILKYRMSQEHYSWGKGRSGWNLFRKEKLVVIILMGKYKKILIFISSSVPTSMQLLNMEKLITTLF